MKGFLIVMVVLFAFGTGLTHAQPLPPSQAGAVADSVKSNKLCPKCGVANLPEARFCYSCGAAFEAGAIPAVLPESARAYTSRAGVCPVCGTVRIPEAQFCSHCGARFTQTLSPGPPRKIESGPKKDPVLALCFSVLMPGAGQFYNGQPVKGGIFMGSYLTGWGLFLAGFKQAMLHIDSGPENAGENLAWAGFVVGGVSWLVSVIDAPVSASDINHRRGYSALTSPGVGLVFVPDSRNPRRLQPGVGLRAGF
jgi:TM2 domain-containing membrane protein YozV/ribosomal protein L40E